VWQRERPTAVIWALCVVVVPAALRSLVPLVERVVPDAIVAAVSVLFVHGGQWKQLNCDGERGRKRRKEDVTGAAAIRWS
jgi:hypothetical protein